jgi:hypothetical protein
MMMTSCLGTLAPAGGALELVGEHHKTKGWKSYLIKMLFGATKSNQYGRTKIEYECQC